MAAKKKYFNFDHRRSLVTPHVNSGNLQRPIGTGANAWRDEIGDAVVLQIRGPGLSLNLAESTVDFAFNSAYNANPALADFLYKNVQLNHDKNLAIEIYPHIHWFQAKNYSPNFLFEYRWQIRGSAKVTAWTKLICNTLETVYAAGTIHQVSETVAGIAVPGGSEISDIVQFRIYRDNANTTGLFAGTDPYNTGGNASTPVLSFDVHIILDSIGSTSEGVK